MAERCHAIGDLTVAGKVVGYVRCEHDEHPHSILHSITIEWAEFGGVPVDWPEAPDPDERFDVDVPMPEPVSRVVSRCPFCEAMHSLGGACVPYVRD